MKTHGMAKSPEYTAYQNARNRCQRPADPRYYTYGARGVEFRFTSFEEFYAEIGPRPEGMTVDRINTDGHYEPGNIQWSTPIEQVRNRTNTRHITIGGVTKPLKAWCEETGQNYKRAWERITYGGWEPERAIAAPAGPQSKRYGE